ncbi:iron chelate uptake ABC transporter family permease subunit [Corynebacterium sp. H127]|uniref:iron chelate uptake ABC transporter family permease subunit n=1 Tax=Corynebacterium sp. H127 TaxID=3133418 RepID=UPI0030B3F622
MANLPLLFKTRRTPPIAVAVEKPVSESSYLGFSTDRTSGSFATSKLRKRYWTILVGMIVLCALFAFGLLAWKNPMPVGSPGFWLIAERRAVAIVVMAIVAVAQAIATVTFQTVTNNRIVTPSIMGFEALYMVIQTGVVFFFGVAGLVAFSGTSQFILQVLLMMALSMALYGWLLTGRFANIQVMLLVGIIIGGGLGSLSAFMRRLLSPSEFDVLTARMFGSVNNAKTEYLPLAIGLVAIATVAICVRAKTLNVVALGPALAQNLGIHHRHASIYFLCMVSILISVSTALVGPMTFLGFLVATLAYQLAETYDHRAVLPMSIAAGFLVLTSAYFIMNHIFYAQGVVSIIIELVGGSVFLFVLLRKGRL